MKLAHEHAEADVVVENYRPGIMAKFDLDYASLKDEFPALVYCSISGFGQAGPQVHRAAYAPIAHAASGFDYVHKLDQIDSEAPPPVWGIMVADMLTGSYAHGAILTAPLARASGRGDYIDVTMLESMMMPSHLTFNLLKWKIATRRVSTHLCMTDLLRFTYQTKPYV